MQSNETASATARPRRPRSRFLANGAPSATPVGTADLVAPADDADALWLTSYLPTANTATAIGTAREVNPAGAPLGRPSAFRVATSSAREPTAACC